jgi:hypothetical protein
VIRIPDILRNQKKTSNTIRNRIFFDGNALVKLTAVIAWEDSSSKFNHALWVPSQGLWRQIKDR